jgi:hypothetical protein
MRLARQQAISTRLVYRLTFNAPSGIVMDQLINTSIQVSGVASAYTKVTNVSNDSIPSTVSFQILSGTPVDQDGFCTLCQTGSNAPCSCQPPPPGGLLTPTLAIDLNGSNQIYFQPDGAGRDANSKICNGVVYLALTGDMGSARAVTVWGSTGQIKLYKLFNSTAGYAWK